MIGEHVLILDWWNSKYFVGQLGEFKFLHHISLIVENFLGSQKLKIFKNEKRKRKSENELIKIN